MTESGWYRDPTGQHELRWFDGATWTDHVRELPATPESPVVQEAQPADSLTVDTSAIGRTPVPSPIPAVVAPPSPLPEAVVVAPVAPVAQTAEDVLSEPPTPVFVIGVGLTAVVWSQVLVSVVLGDAYRSNWLELFASLLVAGCGVTAALLWPSGRQRLAMAVPAAAVGTYAAVAVLPDEWAPAAIGIGMGVAVGATAWSVGLGAAATGLALLAGETIGWWRWEALVPDRLAYVDSEPLHLLLALAGPLLIAVAPAYGMVLASRTATGSTFGGPQSWAADAPPELQPGTAAVPTVIGAAPEVVMAFVVRELVGAGALVTTQSPHGVAGHVVTKKRPSILVAILLWFICIIPMVIYLVNGSKDVQEPFSLTFATDSGGTRIDIGGVGRGLAAARWVTAQAQQAWAPSGPQAPSPSAF